MKTKLILPAVAGLALALGACSSHTENATAEATNSALNDAAANLNEA